MRCYCCDVLLTPKQSTRRFTASGMFTDMCDKCLDTINIDTTDGNAPDEYSEDDDAFSEDDFFE